MPSIGCKDGWRGSSADLAIPDITAVEIIQEVHESAERQNPRVDAADKTFASLPVFDKTAAFESDLGLFLYARRLLMMVLQTTSVAGSSVFVTT